MRKRILPEESVTDLLRAVLRTVRMRTAARRNLAERLEPRRELERLDGGWLSTGDDPQMEIPAARLGIGRGWWMVELNIGAEASRGRAALYIDYGEGMSEELAVPLPFRSRRTLKRLVNLERRPRALRFDPLDEPGEFQLNWFRMIPVTPAFALDRMRRRVENFRLLGDPDGDLEKRYAASFEDDGAKRSYEEWIERVESPAWAAVDDGLDARLERLGDLPLISILVPTYNTDPALLHACIASVTSQSYPRWELCVADDHSSNPDVREVLESASAADPRVRFICREENGHISAASNTALGMAEGEYVALLDHDDSLARHALLEIAEALHRQPDAVLVYSDEDKIDESGERSEPHFKSGWNPDLLLAQNYICHLTVMRRDRVEEVGGFREGFEGSQDHDLLLRATRGLRPEQVVHIPKILYHWRAIAGSTAATVDAKSYAWDAGVEAVRDAARSHEEGPTRVERGSLPHTYRVRWPVPVPAPRATIIIPTRDGLDILSACVESVLGKTRYPNFELVIVDNQSSLPETLEYFESLESDERVRVLAYDAPFNFSAINNFAVKETSGEVVVLLNNDVEVIEEGWLEELVSQALRPDVGCVGAKLHYSDGRIQHGGVVLGIGGVAGHAHKYFPMDHSGYFGRLKIPHNVSAVTAACLAVRRSTYEEVGGLDEVNLRVAFNDVDFCLKVRARGYRNLFTPHARLYHHESISRGDDNRPDQIERFSAERDHMREVWARALDDDPYYNPNLTLSHEDFSLR